MSLKAELETWAAALKAYDAEDFEQALELFNRIADSSKILTNIGLIYATLGEHDNAVSRFREATGLDQYLAVAYFQCGVSNFLLGRFDLAHSDFEEALLYLRGNQAINYEQLGLKFRLFSAEVLFNKGLSLINLDRMEEGLADMEEAKRDKATDEHNVIDDAIQDRGEGYTVFSIPVGVLYRPSEKKLKNSVTKDYMGKAKLIASSDPDDAFTTFTGSTRLKQGISPSGVYVERPDLGESGLSRNATAPSASKPGETRANALTRSQTTLNVPSNARELTSPVVDRPERQQQAEAPIVRKITQITPVRASPNGGIGGPVRATSPKRVPPGKSGALGPTPPAKNADNRLTEFYDDYLDSYTATPAPPLAGQAAGPPDRIAAWARNNANPPTRSGSRSAPASQYAPSSYGGGGSMRRKVSRQVSRNQGRIQSAYEEEEEGYVSGEYEDKPFDLIKIRVKVHYQDDVRGMALTPEMPFEEFIEKITTKFGKDIGGLSLKFKDEDGGKVTLQDESDYELAIETARESSKGRPEGKLEIWVTEL